MADGQTNSALPFMKMHGAGNDFVVIDTRGQLPVSARLARALGDRHRGVGFDQLAEILPGVEGADIGLRFWNADGTIAGACGNATRCVAAHLMTQNGTTDIAIRTDRGLLHAKSADGETSVNMGLPQFTWQEIPLSHDVDPNDLPLEGDPMAVGMGNPHCVYFVDDIDAIDVAGRGRDIETNPLFPQATNVEFAQIRSPSEIRMRVWERGTGITLACGSGACATAIAAHSRGLTGPNVRMELDGGWLTLDITDEGVWMAGPTATVFDGVLTPEFLKDLV